jgi:hypothetical protein
VVWPFFICLYHISGQWVKVRKDREEEKGDRFSALDGRRGRSCFKIPPFGRDKISSLRFRPHPADGSPFSSLRFRPHPTDGSPIFFAALRPPLSGSPFSPFGRNDRCRYRVLADKKKKRIDLFFAR